MEMDVRVVGYEEMVQMLHQLDLKKQNRIVRSALRAGAVIVQSAISEAAPVNEWPLSPNSSAQAPGALKNDIGIRIAGSAEDYIAIVGPLAHTEQLARWVEYGHRIVRGGYSRIAKDGRTLRGPGKEVGRVDAHPFIRPAFERVRGEAVQAIQKTLISKLMQAVRQRARKAA